MRLLTANYLFGLPSVAPKKCRCDPEKSQMLAPFASALRLQVFCEKRLFDLHRDHRPTGHNLKMQSVAFQPCADPPPDNANPILRSTVSFMRIFHDLQSAVQSNRGCS